MTGLHNFLKRHAKVGIDSNIFIAFVEAHTGYGAQAKAVFEGVGEYNNEAWTSAITIPELLIKPQREGRAQIVRDYEQLLFNSPFSFAKIELTTARRAAFIGGQYSLKVIDALHIASLLDVGVTGFVTADNDFKRVKDLEVFIITG